MASPGLGRPLPRHARLGAQGREAQALGLAAREARHTRAHLQPRRTTNVVDTRRLHLLHVHVAEAPGQDGRHALAQGLLGLQHVAQGGRLHAPDLLVDRERRLARRRQLHRAAPGRHVAIGWIEGHAPEGAPLAVANVEHHRALVAPRQLLGPRPLGRAVQVQVEFRHVHDGVVEHGERGRLGCHRSQVPRAQEHELRLDPDLRQHHLEQARLVLAVSELAREDLGGAVGLVPVDAELQAHVTGVADHVGVDRLGPRAALRGGDAGHGLGHRSADPVVNHELVTHQIPIPARHVVPGGVGAGVEVARHVGPARHVGLRLDPRHVCGEEAVAHRRALLFALHRHVEVDWLVRGRLQQVLHLGAGLQPLDRDQIAEVGVEHVAGRHITHQERDLHRVPRTQPGEHNLHAALIVEHAIARLGDGHHARAPQGLDGAVCTPHPGATHLHEALGRIELHALHRLLPRATIIHHADDPVIQALRQAVRVDLHGDPVVQQARPLAAPGLGCAHRSDLLQVEPMTREQIRPAGAVEGGEQIPQLRLLGAQDQGAAQEGLGGGPVPGAQGGASRRGVQVRVEGREGDGPGPGLARPVSIATRFEQACHPRVGGGASRGRVESAPPQVERPLDLPRLHVQRDGPGQLRSRQWSALGGEHLQGLLLAPEGHQALDPDAPHGLGRRIARGEVGRPVQGLLLEPRLFQALDRDQLRHHVVRRHRAGLVEERARAAVEAQGLVAPAQLQ